MVDDVAAFLLRVHQIIRKYPKFPVEFRRKKIHTKPLRDRLNDAGGGGTEEQIIRTLLSHIPAGDVFLVFVPKALDLHVKILNHAQIAEKLAQEKIFRDLPHLTKDQILHRHRQVSDQQLRMALHAPEGKENRTIRIKDRAVKVVYVHLVFRNFANDY